MEHVLQETSHKLLTESLKVCETHIQTKLGNISEQIKQLTKAHDPEENTWENRLRSLQSKLTNTKSRKLEALEIQFHRQMSTENENRIEKQLNENKKETTIDKSTNISILKDGKTFFRCISEYLNDTQEEHEQIRQEVIDTLSANKQLYSQLINGKFAQHVHNMKPTDVHTNIWTTESEIIPASKTFNIEIFVQTMINGKHEWI